MLSVQQISFIRTHAIRNRLPSRELTFVFYIHVQIPERHKRRIRHNRDG